MSEENKYPSGQDKLWQNFTKAVLYCSVAVAVILALMAFFLT